MSVLKPKRNISHTEYIQISREILKCSIQFVSRLSARYSRLLASSVSNLACELVSCCVKADNSFPSNYESAKMRELYIIKATGALKSLDVMLVAVYDILMLNPEGAFSKKGGDSIPKREAIEKLDRMCENIGGLINKELDILGGIRRSAHSKVKQFEPSKCEYVFTESEQLEGQIGISNFEFELKI